MALLDFFVLRLPLTQLQRGINMSRSERFFKEHHERLIKSQHEYSSATKQFSSNMNDADLKECL